MDIQTINLNYIVRIIILSLFIFKSDKLNLDLYESKVKKFLNKRASNIYFKISNFSDIPTSDKREMKIDSILDSDPRSDLSNLIVVNIKTALKEVYIQIDLGNEEKYNLFLYG